MTTNPFSEEIEKAYKSRFKLQEEYLGVEKPVNKIDPLVSVVVMTYQHATYIRECIDSILSQKTLFPFEIVIGEDGSSDGTREICIEYAEKYLDKIRLFLRDRSLSQFYLPDGHVVRFNSLFTREATRGKYIAVCEGDDYWTDDGKLTAQVTEMEGDGSISICSHNYMEYLEEQKIFRKNSSDEVLNSLPEKFSYSYADMPCWVTQPLTVMHRKEDYPSSELIFSYTYWRDNHVVYYLLKKGKGLFLNSSMGIYRKTGKGIYTSLNAFQAAMIDFKIFQELYDKNPTDRRLRKRLFEISVGLIRNAELYKIENGREVAIILICIFKTIRLENVKHLFRRVFKIIA